MGSKLFQGLLIWWLRSVWYSSSIIKILFSRKNFIWKSDFLEKKWRFCWNPPIWKHITCNVCIIIFLIIFSVFLYPNVPNKSLSPRKNGETFLKKILQIFLFNFQDCKICWKKGYFWPLEKQLKKNAIFEPQKKPEKEAIFHLRKNNLFLTLEKTTKKKR